jgi:hypothetical protein
MPYPNQQMHQQPIWGQMPYGKDPWAKGNTAAHDQFAKGMWGKDQFWGKEQKGGKYGFPDPGKFGPVLGKGGMPGKGPVPPGWGPLPPGMGGPKGPMGPSGMKGLPPHGMVGGPKGPAGKGAGEAQRVQETASTMRTRQFGGIAKEELKKFILAARAHYRRRKYQMVDRLEEAKKELEADKEQEGMSSPKKAKQHEEKIKAIEERFEKNFKNLRSTFCKELQIPDDLMTTHGTILHPKLSAEQLLVEAFFLLVWDSVLPAPPETRGSAYERNERVQGVTGIDLSCSLNSRKSGFPGGVQNRVYCYRPFTAYKRIFP